MVNKKANSSQPGISGPHGGSRLAQGKNVMNLYIEHANGTSVDGTIAGQMREFIRSIWAGLYD